MFVFFFFYYTCSKEIPEYVQMYCSPGGQIAACFLWLLLPLHLRMLRKFIKHVKNTDIYDFVDELANVGVIDINSAIKPYSRKFIAQKTCRSIRKREELNARQMKDLDFYLLDFNKELKPDKNFKKRLICCITKIPCLRFHSIRF